MLLWLEWLFKIFPTVLIVALLVIGVLALIAPSAVLSAVQFVCKFIFGDFEREELKKFLRMGLIFACVIGSYWTLRALKDSVLINLVDKSAQPWAKTFSLICLVPILMFYTRLFDRYSREKVFYLLATLYTGVTVVFSILLLMPHIGQAPAEIIAAREGFAFYGTKVLGFLWYAFVESYGSLIVSLFWAIAADVTVPDSARRGFPLVVAIGQIGGMVGPGFITKLPRWAGLSTSALTVFVASGLIYALIYLMRYFLVATPKDLLVSFYGKNEEAVEQKQEPGFLEGLRLLLQHKYLLGIFAVICFYEVIVQVFDFHFKYLAGSNYSGIALDEYLGSYSYSVNTVALISLLLGVSNITRFLGVGVALALMPIIVGSALYGFISINSLNFLFWLMVGSKAINYALNGPAMKQLYVPTTPDVRFKSQAWIETFGSRGSKELGSIFNMTLKPLTRRFGDVAGRMRHILFSAYLGFALVALWFFIAIYLGRTYKKAVDQKKVVC